MVKNTEDMEDIIKLLIDLLDNVDIKYDVVTLKLREYHYCIKCMQHFRGCKCEFVSSSSSSSSEELSDYESSIYESSGSDSETDGSSDSGSDIISDSDVSSVSSNASSILDNINNEY